jgi:hypothetical protein
MLEDHRTRSGPGRSRTSGRRFEVRIAPRPTDRSETTPSVGAISALIFAWATFLLQFGALNGEVPRSPGVVVDNTDAVYQFDSDAALTPAEAALNAAVLRVAQTLAGRVEHGVANVPVVNGTPPVPVLTLHDLGDLFVPFSMEQFYARRVAAAGLSDRVVQRAIRGVGHCDFTPAEHVTAFTDLVRWVEGGVKPPGHDVLTPAVVSPLQRTAARSRPRRATWGRSPPPVPSRTARRAERSALLAIRPRGARLPRRGPCGGDYFQSGTDAEGLTKLGDIIPDRLGAQVQLSGHLLRRPALLQKTKHF